MSLLIVTPFPTRRQVPHLRLVRDEPARRPGPARRAAAVLPVRSVPSSSVSVRDTPVRLTLRGRILIRLGVSLLVLVAVVGGVLLISRPAVASSAPQTVPVSYRIVLPGQTLWQIAGQVAPGVDRRATVNRIIELNALPGAAVTAGQRIAVPVHRA